MFTLTLIDLMNNRRYTINPSNTQGIYDDLADWLYIEHEMTPSVSDFRYTLYKYGHVQFDYHGVEPWNLIQLAPNVFLFEEA